MPPPRAFPLTRPLGGAALLLAGCATRDVPASYPESSAASPEAASAPALQVTDALAGDPPLPGTQAPGWRGLAAQDAAADSGAPDPHAQHRSHQHVQ